MWVASLGCVEALRPSGSQAGAVRGWILMRGAWELPASAGCGWGWGMIEEGGPQAMV